MPDPVDMPGDKRPSGPSEQVSDGDILVLVARVRTAHAAVLAAARVYRQFQDAEAQADDARREFIEAENALLCAIAPIKQVVV